MQWKINIFYFCCYLIVLNVFRGRRRIYKTLILKGHLYLLYLSFKYLGTVTGIITVGSNVVRLWEFKDMKSLLFGIHRVSDTKIRHLNSFGLYSINWVQWVPRVKFQDSLSVKRAILVVHPRSDFSLTRVIPITVNGVFVILLVKHRVNRASPWLLLSCVFSMEIIF